MQTFVVVNLKLFYNNLGLSLRWRKIETIELRDFDNLVLIKYELLKRFQAQSLVPTSHESFISSIIELQVVITFFFIFRA